MEISNLQYGVQYVKLLTSSLTITKFYREFETIPMYHIICYYLFLLKWSVDGFLAR